MLLEAVCVCDRPAGSYGMRFQKDTSAMAPHKHSMMAMGVMYLHVAPC